MASEIYSPRIQAAIADYFSVVDQNHDMQNLTLLLEEGPFAKLFGKINFCGIEQAFRNFRLSTHLFALPTQEANQKFGGVISIHPDDLGFILTAPPEIEIASIVKRLRQCDFLYLPFPTLEILVETVRINDWNYDPQVNLSNLARAGISIPTPGTKHAQFFQGAKGLN